MAEAADDRRATAMARLLAHAKHTSVDRALVLLLLMGSQTTDQLEAILSGLHRLQALDRPAAGGRDD